MAARNIAELTTDNFVILVAGETGSGKSSFINHLVQQDVPVGHGLVPCTEKTTAYAYEDPGGRRIVLVDTPGFGNSQQSDVAIFQDVAYFLVESYRKGIRLAGIVYLHSITANRMSGASVRALRILQSMCGAHFYGHTTVATTMWSDEDGPALLDCPTRIRRQEKLTNMREWFGGMKEGGSRIERHTGTWLSAQSIVNSRVQCAVAYGRSGCRGPVLALQKEVVEGGKTLEQTCAGLCISGELRNRQAEMDAQLEKLRKEQACKLEARDRSHAAVLQEQQAHMERQLRRITENQEQLRKDYRVLEREKVQELADVVAEYDGKLKHAQSTVQHLQKQLRRERRCHPQKNTGCDQFRQKRRPKHRDYLDYDFDGQISSSSAFDKLRDRYFRQLDDLHEERAQRESDRVKYEQTISDLLQRLETIKAELAACKVASADIARGFADQTPTERRPITPSLSEESLRKT